jgi:ubiquinone/menaquinone biosynthesis C-methylase UbiE
MSETHEVTLWEGYARWATTYDQERNGLIEAEEPRLAALAARLGPVRRALDVATGTGRLALRWTRGGAAVVALDQSEAMLAHARAKAQGEGWPITFIVQAIEAPLPFPAAQFDLVSCGLALCHVAHLAGVVQEMGRVLRPGGHLLLTDFHPEAVARGWRTEFVQDEAIYYLPTVAHTRPQYLAAIEAAGCVVVHEEDLVLRDAPRDSFPAHIDVDRLFEESGHLSFGLLVLGQKRSGHTHLG